MRPVALRLLTAVAILALLAQGALQTLHAHPLGAESGSGSSALQAACDLCEMLSHGRAVISAPEVTLAAPAPAPVGFFRGLVQAVRGTALTAPNSRAPPVLS